MGKKRQKVQWFPVDGLAWAGGEDGALQVGGGHQVARARSHVYCSDVLLSTGMHRAAATTEILQVIPQITLCYSAASALIVPTAALQHCSCEMLILDASNKLSQHESSPGGML